jgi:uncharacterized membrane protein SpoIIM required for sporulation/ABC-type transport system involved in multi-copper enzyme maturation permease subunit
MFESMRPVWVITRREVRDQFRDWRIVMPIVALTFFFPWLLNFTAGQLSSFLHRYGAPLIGDRMVPFLLMMVGFFPITISLVIALESFVGEKERRSIEPLLSSPLKDWQLYLGKLLAAIVAPLLAALLGTLVYLVGINRTIGWWPSTTFLTQVVLLTLVQGVVMVSGAVVISSQTTSTRAANLLASFIIVPMALLIEGESVIMFWARYDILWWSILGQVVIAGLLIRMGVSYFNREELIGRELDTLNLRWSWHTFWRAFFGDAHSLRGWFTQELRHTLRRLLLPACITAVFLLAVGLAGAAESRQFSIPSETFSTGSMYSELKEGLKYVPLFSVGGIPVIWLHNLRVVGIATLLAIVSFGVLGLLVLMLPLAITGYLAGAAAAAGLSPVVFLAAFIVPHGILEIPALVLAGAAILRLGATLVTPAQGKTIGEAWLVALADWLRVFLALVVPLLLGAAALEVLVTPRLAQLLLGG